MVITDYRLKPAPGAGDKALELSQIGNLLSIIPEPPSPTITSLSAKVSSR